MDAERIFKGQKRKSSAGALRIQSCDGKRSRGSERLLETHPFVTAVCGRVRMGMGGPRDTQRGEILLRRGFRRESQRRKFLHRRDRVAREEDKGRDAGNEERISAGGVHAEKRETHRIQSIFL